MKQRNRSLLILRYFFYICHMFRFREFDPFISMLFLSCQSFISIISEGRNSKKQNSSQSPVQPFGVKMVWFDWSKTYLSLAIWPTKLSELYKGSDWAVHCLLMAKLWVLQSYLYQKWKYLKRLFDVALIFVSLVIRLKNVSGCCTHICIRKEIIWNVFWVLHSYLYHQWNV